MAKGIDKKGVTRWIGSEARSREWTPERLANMTGISKYLIGAYLTGNKAPSLDHLKAFCKIFGVEADDIAFKYGYYAKPRKKKIVVVKEKKKEENTMTRPDNTMNTTATIIAEVPRPTETVEEPKAKKMPTRDTHGISKEQREAFRRWFSVLQKESGFKREEYAELIGVVNKNSISGYKTGRYMPSLGILQNICKQHGVDWKVAACYFGYADYRVPEAWLGKDYKSNDDWCKIQNVCRFSKCTKDAIAKQAAKPKSDMDALKARIAELEQQNADILAERNNVEANWQKLNAELREQNEELRKHLGEVNTELKKRIDLCEATKAELKDLREQNVKLGKVAAAISANEVEKYLLGLKHYIREALPKAETVEVTCPGGADICWKIKLPGMENALAGHLSVDAFAGTIAKGVKDEVLSRFGLN